MSDSPINILLLEDSPGDARMVRELLSAGPGGWFQLQRANRLSDGLDILASGGIDVVLCDLGLPDSQGLATLERVQAVAPTAPVVVFSGTDDTELAITAVQSGAQDFLVKGITSREVLTRSLRYAIERKRLHLEQKEAEARVRESEEQFRAVLESAPDAIVIVEDEGNIRLVNAQAEQLFGYARNEMVGQALEILMPLDSRGRHLHHRSAYCKSPEARPMGSRMTLMGLRKDGTEFPIEVCLSPIRTRSRVWVAAAIRDVTERKNVEEQLIFERHRAEEGSRSKSAFLAAMSHEIRSPMNAILGMSELLWESELNPEQRQYVEIFRRAGSNLLALIDDILDLSKIEAGHLELEHIQFKLEEILHQALELVAERARKKNLLLSSVVEADVPPYFLGDPGRLRQVLVNLLGNAVKFTERGEIRLRVQTCERETGKILFGVSDTGIGIAPGKLAMIFDDFTQADSTTTRKYGGTGLGLGISRRIVEQMGGELNVTSIEGSGSVFVFTAKLDPCSPPIIESRRQVEDLFGLRVLAVTGNPTDSLFLRETLNSWGMEVCACKTLTDALVRLESESQSKGPYSLIILDDDDGSDRDGAVTTRIKAIAGRTPIIVLTSQATPNDAADRAQSGFAAVAVKPIVRTDLVRLICEVLPDKARSTAPDRTMCAECSPVDATCGLEILVAEDSPDNRALIAAYLKGSPHKLTFVEHGKSAVDRFATGQFDLVLMDIQMPVMDGLSAAQAIRHMELETHQHRTPIVALTANARAQDRTLSYQAGCDAHLSKPISKQKLLATIAEHSKPCAPEKPAGDVIRISIPEGLEQLVPGYLAARRNEVPEMMSLLAKSDFERLRTLAHNMKGTAQPYGFPDLMTLAAALEKSAGENDVPNVTQQLKQIADYVGRVQLAP